MIKQGLFVIAAYYALSFPSFAKQIDDQYIILFNESEVVDTDSAIARINASGKSQIRITKKLNKVFKGAVARLNNKELARLQKLPFVSLIEPDGIAKPAAVSSWGLDRIDQRNLPLNGTYNIGNNGNGVNVYVVDSGLNASHIEFTGRVGTVTSVSGLDGSDCIGHGTHVAGTIGGNTVGVAPGVTINSVQINYECVNGYASFSDQLAAMDWIVANALPNSVVNLSYTIGSESVRLAIDEVIRDGHVFVNASGNDGVDACSLPTVQQFPPATLSIGNTQSNDSKRSSSNYGSCVDIFAPGTSIFSAYKGSSGTYATATGTSMASPHVAGVAAIYRSLYPNDTPYDVMAAVVNSASNGKLSGIGSGSPNKLLYSPATRANARWVLHSAYWSGSSSYTSKYLPPSTCTPGQSFITATNISPYASFKEFFSCESR